jgi:hypothetical protein
MLWLALAGFATVTAIGLRAHTLWFDEMQAWNIARASRDLGDLWGNLRYEGHPILWYLPLFALSRVTGDPHVMQLLQFAVAVSTAALVLFRAPLRPWLRVGLVAGYFFAFEYGVFSRSYGLGALLLISALVTIARSEPRWGRASVLLVLLACTSLPGAVLAIAIAASVVFDRRLRVAAGARVFGVVVGVTTLVVAMTCVPPADFGDLTPGLGNATRFGNGFGFRVGSSLTATWRALVPVPATVGEWNSNLLDELPGAVWIEAALAIGLFAVVLAALWPHRFARRLWWVGSLGLTAFFLVVTRPDAARHAGFVLLLFVACVWCAHAPPGEVTHEVSASSDRRGALGTLVVVVVAAQVLATSAVYPSASTDDFSRDRVLADVIERAGLQDAIVSAQDWDGTTIGGYLDAAVHSVARGERIRFLTTDDRQERGIERMTGTSVVCAAVHAANARAGPVAVVVEGTLPGYRALVERGASLYRIEPGPLPPGCDA